MFDNLAENITALDEAGLLRRVSRPVDKDTEMMPLVRCQFRGLDESQRTAWLFENPTDARGREYDVSVGIALVAPSREVYRFNLGCETDAEIGETWEAALERPIQPTTVSSAPVEDVVLEGSDLRGPGNGVDAFPIPISTPGFDPAPFLTAASVVTRDPETGVVNVGTYRCEFVSSDTFRVFPSPGQDARAHWETARENGDPLESAVVIGVPPDISMVSVSKVPHDTSEFAVAGGLRGEPLEMVECETVDIRVPACAEIVIEGEITPETYEEGPFGEFTGYMGQRTETPNFEVSRILHREDPTYQAFISQMPPSESSMIRKVGYEQNILQHLRNTSLVDVQDVALHESSGSVNFLVIQLDKRNAGEPWQAMYAALGYSHQGNKFTVAVGPDVDPNDLESVVWAMSSRVRPDDDVRKATGRRSPLDPSSAPPDVPLDERAFPDPSGDAALLVDATCPWDFPPISLPKREFMERAVDLWDDLDLPELDMVEPWYGVSLGEWSDEEAAAADAAVRGEYYGEE